ncbi:hypothetical protein EZS27_020377 [termite gut metagenome]|uniref:Uncharacterized protein n=1 Tax=termite gut metagenome TaxID=433724 RepID=A0A5J4RB97_9ZZZZ
MDNDTLKTRFQAISAIVEMEKVMKFLKTGLFAIQTISPANNFYDPVFMFLSSDLERLFKIMFCLNFKDNNGCFPKQNEIWKNKNGHDLLSLKTKIEQVCIPIDRPFASMDYDIITQDDFIKNVCIVLSEYGQYGRYFNLDLILGKEQMFNPQDEWEKLETQIGKEIYGEQEFYRLMESNQLDNIYRDLNEEIIIRLEMFFRALTRQFIFGKFSQNWYNVYFFSDINDEQLGKTNYRNQK